MRARRLVLAMAAAALLAPADPARAQSWSGFVERLEVKKRFDGGRDEQEAAQVALVAPDGWESRYLLVDAAARGKAKTIAAGRTTIFLAPVVEYHRADSDPLRRQKDYHQLTTAASVEAYYDRDLALMPNVLFKAALTRNFLDEVTEAGVAAFVSVYSATRFGPGAPLVVGLHRVGRYVPSVGLEYFHNVAIRSGSEAAGTFEGGFATARLFTQWYPFNRAVKPGDIRFSIEVDGHLRRRMGDDEAIDRVIASASAGATYYLVAGQRLGIGLSGDFGRSPASNFVNQRRVVLALRIQLSPG